MKHKFVILILFLTIVIILFYTKDNQKKMSCNKNVKLYGVLALCNGLGNGMYKSREPFVHGLWPTVGEYGNSKCISPKNNNITNINNEKFVRASTCFSNKYLAKHEFKKHGECAGVKDEEDYFNQVCSLSKKPLELMKNIRYTGITDINEYANIFEKNGYHVWYANSDTSEIELSAYANPNFRWILMDSNNFKKNCR